MKTKNGQCSTCPLIDCKRNKKFIVSNCDSDMSQLDIFIVTKLSDNCDIIVKHLKDNYSKLKYVICDDHVCLGKSTDEIRNFCFSNFSYIANKCQSKNKFIVGLRYQCDISGFNVVNNIEELFSKIKKLYDDKPADNEKQANYYMFSIPDKYYTDEYRLVDIQYLNGYDKLIYIFRDKENKKHYYEYPQYEKDFYWYECISSNKIIEKIDNLKLCFGRYQDRNRTSFGYGGDINIATQHTVDYYLKTKGEAPIIRQNILFFDIETYQYHDNIFPDPNQAKYPITAISFRTDREDDFTHVYLLKINGEIDSRIDDIFRSGKYPYITLFNDEKAMLRAWFQAIKKCDVDFLAGWNVGGFDIPYIIKRMQNLKIPASEISEFGYMYGDKNGRNFIAGYTVMDQLKLYKDLTYITQPSYSLNYIAGVVLGKEKVQHAGKSIDVMYREDIELFMRYSQVDTQLIYEIEEDVKHIALQDEIRRVATTSQDGAKSTIGQADGLYTTSMKKKGLIARNYNHDVQKESLPGAYVFDAKGGLYEGLICDFDFRSLYPSIINTWNIGPDSYIALISQRDARDYIFSKNNLKNKKISMIVDPVHSRKKVELDLNQFEKFIDKYKAHVTIIGTIFCGHEIYESINYSVLTMLLKSRKLYKAKMLTSKEAGQKQLTVEYNGKQMAYKILANSLYGVLGNEHFKFYNIELGKSITLTGQEMLKYCAVHTDYYMRGKFKNKDDFRIDPDFDSKVNDAINILYGDTDSMFVYLTDYLKSKHIEVKKSPEVLKEVSEIQDYINGVIIPVILERHKINMKYSEMYLKNEFLMSRYYALNAKKKYASKVISQEGKDICERDIKGLEIKRSEIPSRTQKLLSDIIDTILDENLNKKDLKPTIDKIVKDTKQEMLQLIKNGDPSIARIVAFSKDLSEYKNMPQNIKSMLMWNALIGREDFRTGSKGHLWNILGIDLNKAPKEIVDNYHNIFKKKFFDNDLKAIATPEDVDKLPDYFVVDIKAMIKYCCDDRCELLLEPLWVENDNSLLF